MGNYKVEFLPAALEDLDNIFDFILLENPFAAEKMLTKINTSLRNLECFPKSGVRLTEKTLKIYNFRSVIIEPYIAFYRFIDDKVYIYRILHGTRDYIKILQQHD